MAIIIPSAKTYNRQNPKIRDNVIERIEVGAVEVVPDNEYNTPVYNEKIKTVDVLNQDDWQEHFSYYSGERSYTYFGVGAVVGLSPFYKKNISIKIPKLKNNHYISKLFQGEEENQVKYSVEYKKYVGTCSIVGSITTSQAVSVESRKLNYNQNGETINGELPKTITREEKIDYWTPSIEKTTAEKTLNDLTNLSDKNILIEETEDYWQFGNIIVLCGIETYSAGFQWVQGTGQGNTRPSGSITLTGECEKYVPVSIEITFYGNTIGIDLVDKTVYINGETQKKVHSVEGNELIQTSNFELINFDISKLIVVYQFDEYGFAQRAKIKLKDGLPASFDIKIIAYNSQKNQDETFYILKGETETEWVFTIDQDYEIKSATIRNENIIDKMYGDTQKQYSNGKETAVIRCSIGDYYESCVGDKIIEEDLQNNDKRLSVSGNYLIFTPNYESKVVRVFDFEGESQEEDVQLNAELQDNGTIKFWWEQGTPNNFKSLRFLVELSTEKTLKITPNQEELKYSIVKEDGLDSTGHYATFITVTLEKPYLYDVIVWYEENYGGEFEEFSAIIKSGETVWHADFDPQSQPNVIEVSMLKPPPMLFQEHDEVLPMVYGADGNDYPMSLYKDGTPKVFTVLMVKPYYDGAVWQELTLQEKYKEL